jgi:hypothetical protein
VLVAGGSGIAVVFPLVWALLHEANDENDVAGDGAGYGGDGGRDGGVDDIDGDEELVTAGDRNGKGGQDERKNNNIGAGNNVLGLPRNDEQQSPDDRHQRRRAKRRVHLLWVTHEREHREWVPGPMMDSLVERGLELAVPEPTAEAGRPDVLDAVNGWIEGAAAEGREVGVVVSGPDGLNRAVRNACADAIGRGSEVHVAVEKFGW